MLGCDLHCAYCQNWDISQALRDADAGQRPNVITPEHLVAAAQRCGARCIASSYNEPLITSEWAMDVFRLAKDAGFTRMYVSNGNATREVLEYIRPYTDGYKVDLKTMSDKGYRQLGAVRDHILDGIRMVHELGFWEEIVTLLVPGFNDSEDELREAARFIHSVSPDIPWHITAFHRDYRMQDHDDTDVRQLMRAAEIGYEEGLHFVYAGNRPGQVGRYEHTYCPTCGFKLIERTGYVVLAYRLTGEGDCPKCGTHIPGIWPTSPSEVHLGRPSDLWLRRPRAAW
jgi:pyruvate formate lyase activating enzyme